MDAKHYKPLSPMMKNRSFPTPESLSLEVVWAKSHRVEPGWTDFAPRIACASLWHVLEGSLRAESEGETQIARAGDWVWRAPSGARRMETASEGARWHSVGMVAMRGGKNYFAPPQAQILQIPAQNATRGATLMELLTSGEAGSDFERDGLARALMGWLWRVANQKSAPEFPLWLENALQQVEANPAVSVGELARGAHFSPAQFRRVWEKHLGMAPRDTLLGRRLEIARRLLESEAWSIGEVAARSGFAGAAQFSRAFRAAFGASPGQWRRAAQSKF